MVTSCKFLEVSVCAEAEPANSKVRIKKIKFLYIELSKGNCRTGFAVKKVRLELWQMQAILLLQPNFKQMVKDYFI